MRDSTMAAWAKQELKAAGYSPHTEDELDREIYYSTMEIINAFTSVGHSGYSAMAHAAMIQNLLSWEPLTDLTDNPEEWSAVAKDTWQSWRNPKMFSEDGGQTYYSVDELRYGWKATLFGRHKKIYKAKPSGSY